MTELEKIPLMVLYSEDGQIKVRVPDETKVYELFGFLTCYLKNMEEGLRHNLQPDDN